MKLIRAQVFLLPSLLVIILLAAANASPLKPGLVATRRLVDLTAQRLRQTDQYGPPSSGVTCEACKLIVDTLDVLFMENKTQDDIVDVITTICIDLKIEDRNVCTLVVKEFQVSILLFEIIISYNRRYITFVVSLCTAPILL